MKKILLGGGCFWCIEAVFKKLKGVETVKSGYAGGRSPRPVYEQICTGTTGHAEVVQVEYDPETLDETSLLEVFFSVHDPTTLNRQGNDVGTQYRSVVFYADASQKKAALSLIRKMDAEGTSENPVVTEVKPLVPFHEAESHHQNYYQKQPFQPYCLAVIRPKIKRLLSRHPEKIK